MKDRDPGQLSMLELFRVEAETQTATLTDGLLALERGEGTPAQLESLMRAAHSLKGAALLIHLAPVVRVAHQMENAFVAAQFGHVRLNRPQIDTLLRGVDLLLQISQCNEANFATWEEEQAGTVEKFLSDAAIIFLPQPTKTAAEIAASPTEVLGFESNLSTPDSRLQTSGLHPSPRPPNRGIELSASRRII
jgi:two-component system sensor histidine kinase and response regulator WspE